MAKAELEYGIQECSKCEYKLRCEECAYNEKGIEKIVNDARKETAEKFAKKLIERFKNTNYWFFVRKDFEEIYKEITEGVK